jgi:hypothetical protein
MPRPTGQWGLLTLFAAAKYGTRWETLLWLKPDSTLPGTFNVQTAANTLYGVYANSFANMMTSDANFLGGRLYVGNGTYTASADANSVIVGALSDGALPPDDTVIVRMQAAVAGRSGKGRFYISGLDLHVITDGRVNTAGDTAMASIITDLTTAQPAGGVSWNVQQYDHLHNVLHLPDFFSYNAVTGNIKKRSPLF